MWKINDKNMIYNNNVITHCITGFIVQKQDNAETKTRTRYQPSSFTVLKKELRESCLPPVLAALVLAFIDICGLLSVFFPESFCVFPSWTRQQTSDILSLSAGL